MANEETLAEMLGRRGISRRAFMKFGAFMSSMLALGPARAQELADAIAGARRRSVIWLSFQECTGCIESLTRSHSPTLEDLIFDFISLDYSETLMAVSGEAAERAKHEAMEANAGEYILVVDGSIPLGDGGIYGTIAGRTNEQILADAAENAFAVVAVGTCATFGGLPMANPNPTGAVSVDTLVTNKPVINISGCPPIPTVMTGVLAHVIAFGTIPPLDHLKRPMAFFGDTIHDRCYRRSFYERGLFAESFDDEGARNGYCLYKVGCKGPVAYNACATQKWNDQTSFPIESGHGCFGCSEPNFWDQPGGIYQPLPAGLLADAPDVLIGAGVGAAVGVGSALWSRARQRKADADSEAQKKRAAEAVSVEEK